jgi:hypothetical protein
MTKSECVAFVQDCLISLLQPVCTENGLSLKLMPSDLDVGVIRQAMLFVFATGYSTSSVTKSGSPVASRQTGSLTVQAYVIVLAASRVGPRSAEWAASKAIEALDGADLGSTNLYTESMSFTSFKDGIWQYRVPVNVTVPYSEPQTKPQTLISW